MDKASLIGILIGCACLGIVFTHASHGNYLMFYSEEGVFTVIGGSISVVFMSMPMERLKSVPGYLRRFMFHKGRSSGEVVKMLSELAEKARRDGILSIESDMDRITAMDPFLASGLRMTIDGMEPAAIEATMRMELLAMKDRHKAGKKFFDLIKVYGPGWGLVGTLIGQVAMFGNLESGSIGSLGKALAIAVWATMYGTVLANAICGPIGDKLALRSADEILNREMILQGVMSIQAGDNPRLTLDKMMSFLPTPARAAFKTAA